MTDDIGKKLSKKYCPRFGQLAVEFGFITEKELAEALACQVHDELNGKERRLLGEILFENDLMSASQIEQVMIELFQRMSQEQPDPGNSMARSNTDKVSLVKREKKPGRKK